MDHAHRASGDEFRRILDGLPAAAYTCDARGLITYFNRQAAQLWGRGPRLNDPVDRYCGSFRLFSPDGSPIDHEHCWMALALRTNQAHNGEEIVVERPDGSRLTVIAHANPLHDESGELVGAVNILVDISEHKRSEELLSSIVAIQQEIATAGLDLDAVMNLVAGRMQELAGATGAVIELVEGDEFVYRSVTGTASSSLGLRLKGATSLSGLCVRTGKTLRCDDTSTDPRVDREACQRVGARSMIVVPLHHEREVVGVLKVLSSRAGAFGESDSQVLQLMAAFLAAALSRSAAFAAEQALVSQRTLELKETEERFRLLVEGVEDYAIYMLDPEGLVVSWNAGAERIKGYRAEQIIGRHFSEFYAAEDRLARKPERHLQKAIEEGRFHEEGRRVRADGSQFWADVLITALWDEDGRLRGFAKVTRDTTEWKNLEEQYRQAQKMEAVGQLAGGVAHDFNNLLTIISGYCDLLLRSLPEDESVRHPVEEIYKAGERAASLTRQLLAFSRKEVIAPKPLDLNAVVAEAEKLIRRLIGEDVRLTTVLAPSLPRVKADSGQMEQIIMNLAVNARDAMPQGGNLKIETGRVEFDSAYAMAHVEVKPGIFAMLSVSDSGTGIDEATKARIFEPFFTTKEQGKGTGLGLATVYGIVKQSGGHIEVQSEPGRGTIFKIFLPVTGEGFAADAPQPVTEPRLDGTETILLVEDEPALRALGRFVLETHGYSVLEANHGGDALLISDGHEGPIHLLVTDVVMPRMGGRQLAQALRERRPGTKVLFLSGYTDDAVVRYGVVEEADPLLQKPFTPGVLAAKVREVLDV